MNVYFSRSKGGVPPHTQEDPFIRCSSGLESLLWENFPPPWSSSREEGRHSQMKTSPACFTAHRSQTSRGRRLKAVCLGRRRCVTRPTVQMRPLSFTQQRLMGSPWWSAPLIMWLSSCPMTRCWSLRCWTSWPSTPRGGGCPSSYDIHTPVKSSCTPKELTQPSWRDWRMFSQVSIKNMNQRALIKGLGSERLFI